jgi:hypothetical protein
MEEAHPAEVPKHIRVIWKLEFWTSTLFLDHGPCCKQCNHAIGIYPTNMTRIEKHALDPHLACRIENLVNGLVVKLSWN